MEFKSKETHNRVSFDINSIRKWSELILFSFRLPTLTCFKKIGKDKITK